MYDQTFIESLAKDLAPQVAELIKPQLAGGIAPTRLLSIDQAAIYLGRSKTSVQHLVAQRRIPVVREGRRVFLDVRELDRWIAANAEPAVQA